jgi:hypothetical protein
VKKGSTIQIGAYKGHSGTDDNVLTQRHHTPEGPQTALHFPGTCTNARTLPPRFFQATAGAKAAEVYEESISSLNILAMGNAASRAAVAVAAVDMSNRRLLSNVADGCENSQPAPPSSGDNS